MSKMPFTSKDKVFIGYFTPNNPHSVYGMFTCKNKDGIETHSMISLFQLLKEGWIYIG